MKFSIVLLCVFSILFSCAAALSKKYFGENVQNHFGPYFEFSHSLSSKDQTVEGIGKLTTSLLHGVYVRAGKNFNIALSPIGIWAILAMLLEGARGKTEHELKTKLQLSYSTHEEGKRILRNRYKELLRFNQVRNSPTEFTALNFVVSDRSKMINPEYKNIIRQFYNGRQFDADSTDGEQVSRVINMWASQVTRNRIRSLISPAGLSNLLLVIGNAVYFKSQWKYPFDPSLTTLMHFKDEYDKPIRKIPMMNQVVVLPYFYNTQLESEIVEIPYADDLTSMTVILPRERVPLVNVLARMKHMNLDQILPRNYTEETVQLIMPKFKIVSTMNLNEMLKQDLGSIFSPEHAEFPFISKNIFVSKISHKAEIENTEEGTTASSISIAQFAYKSSGTIFRANRPFIYLINEKKTKTVLFAGTYSNPFFGW